MALEKITEAQLNANGVIAAPDVLNGTAAENKAIFDRLVRSIVAPAYNACVEAVNALEALDTGLKTSETERVQAELERVAAELNRETAEQSRAAAEQEREAAEEARQNAETGYVAQANNAATRSQSWAEGGTGSREGEDANNAKYWATKAKENAAGGGDMKKNVYDPQGKATDIFKYVEEHGGGSGVHIGPEPPTNGETVWIDTDDTKGSFYTAKQVDDLLAGKVSMELLWENASPTSDFSEQALNFDCSPYEYFVVFIAEAGHPTYVQAVLVPNNSAWVALPYMDYISPGGKGYIVLKLRYAIITNGFFEFSSGRCVNENGNTFEVNDAYVVPQKIYGVKGVTA